MGSERRAVDAERSFLQIIAILIDQAESLRHGKIYLVGGNGEFTPDRAPHLHVDLWSVERGFVRHLNIVDSGAIENVTDHFLRLDPELRLTNKFLAELGGIVRREAHEIFLDTENLEIPEIHLIDGIKLGLELILSAIDVRVIHLH